ncbi:hypothetical protein [Methylibium sp.]|jgi:uncharacterized protein YjiS (DUF1127 family)|uniref:hypothetical protein n=1 Tax=Methylibium sp. TaxID=2067992 RepID=UPI003D10AE52
MLLNLAHAIAWSALFLLMILSQALAGDWRRSMAARWKKKDELDDATLRDLGISRSELPSYAAEAEQRAETTRRRVAAVAETAVEA